MAPSFQWWANESHHGTLVVVKMENLNWSMVELEGPTEDNFLITTDSLGSGCTRDRPPRLQKCQATHLGPNAQSPLCRWLLDLHRLRNVRPCRHLASGWTDFDEIENENELKNDASMEGMGREKENLTVKTRFYFCNKMFLWVSVILLGFGFFFFFKQIFFFFKFWNLFKKKNLKRRRFGSINGSP